MMNIIRTIKTCTSYDFIKKNAFTTNTNLNKTIIIGNNSYQTDNMTNVTTKILSYIGTNKHLQKHHPLSIIRQRIVNFFYSAYTSSRGNPLFSVYDQLFPVVTVDQNFDSLLIAKNHASRSKSDCYYVNCKYLLRAHTTAHQVDLIKSGLDNFLICGEVYRRDEIDSTHFPVFHQLDAVRLIRKDQLFEKNPELEIFENHFKTNLNQFLLESSLDSKCIDQLKQPCHTMEAVKLVEYELKSMLLNLAKDLFGQDIEYRWVETYFPFTQPSWELEVQFSNKWLEVLGCGIMRDEILKNSGVQNSIGYAFGLGLERLAMVLFDIPDIRLFWSNDDGFLSQFNEDNIGKVIKYKPVSFFPQCFNDLSFWLPESIEFEQFCINDFYDVVRNLGGDIIEQVILKDHYKHPKTFKTSLCFRIIYRHMERTLTQNEVTEIHQAIANKCVKEFKVKIR